MFFLLCDFVLTCAQSKEMLKQSLTDNSKSIIFFNFDALFYINYETIYYVPLHTLSGFSELFSPKTLL